MLQFWVLNKRLGNELRREAFLETANGILRVCNRTQGQSYDVTGLTQRT